MKDQEAFLDEIKESYDEIKRSQDEVKQSLEALTRLIEKHMSESGIYQNS